MRAFLKKIMKTLISEKVIVLNAFGAYVVKGASMLLSVFATPLYIRYFDNNVTLGLWYTMLSILTWIMLFDLGIGNGLRNKLASTLANHQEDESRKYITSAYVSISLFTLLLCCIYFSFQFLINWNNILNISTELISSAVLQKSMNIIIVGVLLRFILGLSNSIIFALQKSMVNNWLSFITNFAIYIYISVAPKHSAEQNLMTLSYIHVVLSNLPLLIATIIIFLKPLKSMVPKIKYFQKNKAKEVIKTGTILLWLQIVAMVVLSTHAILITKISGPENVVEYNIYYKVYGSIASILTLVLTPIWSAVTRAKAQRNYIWIKKLHTFLLLLPVVMLIIDVFSAFFLQKFFNLWLGDNTITVKNNILVIMSIFSIIYVLHQVNININNGLSEFKLQSILMTVGAVVMVPLSIILSRLFASWIGVIAACSLAMLPYELSQPFVTYRQLSKIEGSSIRKMYD